MNSNDFTYDIALEDLRRYHDLSPEIILQWLEDINVFIMKERLLPLKKTKPSSSAL